MIIGPTLALTLIALGGGREAVQVEGYFDPASPTLLFESLAAAEAGRRTECHQVVWGDHDPPSVPGPVSVVAVRQDWFSDPNVVWIRRGGDEFRRETCDGRVIIVEQISQ